MAAHKSIHIILTHPSGKEFEVYFMGEETESTETYLPSAQTNHAAQPDFNTSLSGSNPSSA